MSDAATRVRAWTRTAPLIRKAGGDPDALRAVIDEYVAEFPESEPAVILAALKSRVPEAFEGNDAKDDGPPNVELGDLSERERVAYLDKYGLDAYMALIARDSEKRREDAERRRNRGEL